MMEVDAEKSVARTADLCTTARDRCEDALAVENQQRAEKFPRRPGKIPHRLKLQRVFG